MLCAFLNLHAQVYSDESIDTSEDVVSSFQVPGDNHLTHETYCLILGVSTNFFGFGDKVNVQVDFGEKTSAWKGGNENFLVDDEGKRIKFNSMIDAMNYLAQFGWKFMDAYAISIGNKRVYHWLMKKDIMFGEDASEGIKQKRDFEKNKTKEKKDKPKSEVSNSNSFDSIYE